MKRRADGSWLVDGRTPVEEVASKFGIAIENGDFHTAAGLALDRLARIPVEGEAFVMDGWRDRGASTWTASASTSCCSFRRKSPKRHSSCARVAVRAIDFSGALTAFCVWSYKNSQRRGNVMSKKSKTPHPRGKSLRSQLWFDNPENPGMTALYLERYLNFGLTSAELRSGKPIIGIAQTGSDLSPCNRHHLELAERVREGIRMAGGIAFEFPVHPIQETGKRPTAALDRNLAYLGLVEILYGYPLDGVVLTTGCDKTTPACIMAAATVNIPAIVLSGGPMLNGWWKGERSGSGMAVWKARQELAAGRIDYEEFIEIVASSAPSIGHCNTMGTASTMNALAEALGMSLPGCAAIPAPYRERGQIAYETGMRAVEIVREDLKPSDILTRKAFENRHRRQFRDRRLDQRADPYQRDRAAYRRQAHHR